nr:immunoglobulin heavy chain junction region [Macaca mulatta]
CARLLVSATAWSDRFDVW